jgi:catechol 2,3-dioxygenase
MSRRPVISEIGHVAVRVRDLAAAEEMATNLMGLDVTERTDDAIWLSHGAPHHTLQYLRGDVDAVDHVGLAAPDADALAAVRERVEAAGLSVVRDGPDGPGARDGFAFVGPEECVFEIYSEMTQVEPGIGACGVRPSRFGHVNFFLRDPAAIQRMLVDLLDFRVSDIAGEGQFLRCNVDHHSIGVFPGPGLLHHYAWEVPSIAELAAVADLVDRRGGSVLWGPMRHGIGNNISTYFQEPSGLVVEYYAEMERIYDDDHHKPRDWDTDGHKWLTLWGPQPLPDGFTELGLPFARP